MIPIHRVCFSTVANVIYADSGEELRSALAALFQDSQQWSGGSPEALAEITLNALQDSFGSDAVQQAWLSFNNYSKEALQDGC